MAQSKKYTIQIERVLKEYPYICWRINNQQSSLNKELKQMGIRKESIEFLKNIFFQGIFHLPLIGSVAAQAF